MLYLFILINFIWLILFFRRRYTLFFISFFACIFIEPFFQKILDPTFFGKTFDVYGFARVQTNLIMIVFLVFANLFSKFHKIIDFKKIFLFSIFLLFFHILNSILSINVQTSVIISAVSILGPLIFFVLILKIPSEFFENKGNIVFIIHCFICILLLLGLGMYFNNKSIAVDGEFQRSGGLIWMSNVTTQIVVPFFPFIFFKQNFKYKKFLRPLAIILIAILLVVSMSRTALVVYSLLLLLIIGKSKNTFRNIFYISIVVSILLLMLNFIFNINVFDSFAARFFMDGGAIETISQDERFTVYKQSINSISQHPFLGVGIGNFNLINERGYTNSHNIFLNILVERGVLGFILLLNFMIYYINLNSKIRTFDKSKNEIFRLFLIGFLAYFAIGMTGNDLFISSGFINGWGTYILLFFLAFQIHSAQNITKDIKLNEESH